MLILLGGAILVAVIVGIALKNLAEGQSGNTTKSIKCTIQDCTTCKTTDDCAGYQLDGTILFDGSHAAAPCDATEQTLFKNCSAK